MLMSYHWPGNVRELENALERSVLVCDGQVIHGHHLPPSLQTADASGTVTRVSLKDAVEGFERDLIQDALKTTRGNRAKAARLLDTTERILNYKVRNLDVDVRRFKASEAARRVAMARSRAIRIEIACLPSSLDARASAPAPVRLGGMSARRWEVRFRCSPSTSPLGDPLRIGAGRRLWQEGPPLAPIVRIPAAIDAIAAQRSGSDVFVTLTVPAKNIDCLHSGRYRPIEVYGYTGRVPPPRTRWVEIGALIAIVPVAPPVLTPPVRGADAGRESVPRRSDARDLGHHARHADPKRARPGSRGRGHPARMGRRGRTRRSRGDAPAAPVLHRVRLQRARAAWPAGNRR